ncbi:uncharacterized protein SPSK_10133 [Sporothrix schenckii 1099-18]|uniref:Uncharacterized protein n=1 Tax=Sporothrix schenckii 1099-18 TaxID=1397361 RepID=A0A0F2MA00_SPOSC|nr:uncharacterized protein SPSK_10133 [Sporothrix schenckii 1099-18]KJR85655.1 hypothetical protein SPSK_10133 [Sporothrix schenckii 1099-18]
MQRGRTQTLRGRSRNAFVKAIHLRGVVFLTGSGRFSTIANPPPYAVIREYGVCPRHLPLASAHEPHQDSAATRNPGAETTPDKDYAEDLLETGG